MQPHRLIAGLLTLVLLQGCAAGREPPRPGAFSIGGGGFSVMDRGLPVSGGYEQQPRAAAAAFPNIGYATWTDQEPDYRIAPGDVLDIAPVTAPELARTVTVQPDGRITLPLVPPIMVADRSVPQVEYALAQAYSTQLVRPEVSVNVKTASPLKVFVGGEVDKPGVYDMPGDIDALQAVIMAGGFKTSARRSEVIVIRRGAGGQPMMRTANLSQSLYQPIGADSVPLRRYDVIYVPRSTISNIGLFVQQYIRDAIPLNFSYSLNGGGGGTQIIGTGP
jgi:polysaccharide export outer membrane protein